MQDSREGKHMSDDEKAERRGDTGPMSTIASMPAAQSGAAGAMPGAVMITIDLL